MNVPNAEMRCDALVEKLWRLFEWSDRSYVHAYMHIDNAVNNLRAMLSVETRDAAEYKKRLDFLESKGLKVTYAKTSDQPEPYLVYIVDQGSELDDTRSVVGEIEAGIKARKLEAENTFLRGLLSKAGLSCAHCGLADMSKCASGFPGCAQADDMMAAMDEGYQDLLKRFRQQPDSRISPAPASES